MAKADKVSTVAEITEKFRSSNAAVITEYRGLTMAQLTELRRYADEDLKKKLDTLAARRNTSSRVSFKNLGFTTQVDELMSASDILLGKPGGLTTSEALAKGLVFVIVNPIPGQEERNSDHLLEEGVAIRCNNLPALSYKVDQLLEDTSRFSRMQANALRLARPNAAHDIVNRLLELHDAR